MKRLLGIGAGLMALAGMLAVASLSGRGSAVAATQTVSIQDNVFAPSTITINAGDTVQWDWVGSNQHSVTADDASFDSALRTGGPSFSQTFSAAGTYAYYCLVHGAPGGAAMSGTVIVQAAPTVTNTTVAPTSTIAPTRTPEPTSTGATATPVTATATVESPATTATPAPVVSAAPATAPAASVATPPASGAAAGSAALPRAGDGPSGGAASIRWLSIVLAALGAATLASAVVVRKRAQ